MKIHFKRIGAISAAVTTAGLISMTSVAGASSLSRWDGFSHRHDRFDISKRTNIRNTNDVRITNVTSQTARSGDVRVFGNRFVGDVRSGNATNINSSNFDVNIRNR